MNDQKTPDAGERSAPPTGSVLYRCGWCGHPTDKDGVPSHTDDPGAYVDAMEKSGAKTERLNGACCPQGDWDEL
jgi:hypothetical protein